MLIPLHPAVYTMLIPLHPAVYTIIHILVQELFIIKILGLKTVHTFIDLTQVIIIKRITCACLLTNSKEIATNVHIKTNHVCSEGIHYSVTIYFA